MKKGKRTCKILKDIRREIARANDIDLVISECKYQGECLGTCPKCEAEVRYLEEQLTLRRRAGKAVALAGIMAGAMMLPVCSEAQTVQQTPESKVQRSSSTRRTLSGLVARPQKKDKLKPVRKALPETKTEEVVTPPVEGMVAFSPDTVAVEMPPQESTCETSAPSPSYPGGHKALQNDIDSIKRYPKSAADRGVEGTVWLRLDINEMGEVSNVEVIISVDADLDAEAVRTVKLLPQKFIPQEIAGKPEKGYQNVPVHFKLEK